MVLHSNTYYTVPTASCSDAVTKKGAKVWQPLSCTQTQQKETTGNTRPDLTTLLQSYGHMVGESTIWWIKVIIPQKESVWQWSVDYHKFHMIRQWRFHTDGSHHDFGENIQQWLGNVTNKHHNDNDISLPLHKHLRLWIIHTIMYVEYVTNQLEF